MDPLETLSKSVRRLTLAIWGGVVIIGTLTVSKDWSLGTEINTVRLQVAKYEADAKLKDNRIKALEADFEMLKQFNKSLIQYLEEPWKTSPSQPKFSK